MDEYFECLKCILDVQNKNDIASCNIRFFLKLVSCISEPYDFIFFVKGIFDFDFIITPELTQDRCSCSLM